MATNCNNNFISDILEKRFTASSVLTQLLKTKGTPFTSRIRISLLKVLWSFSTIVATIKF